MSFERCALSGERENDCSANNTNHFHMGWLSKTFLTAINFQCYIITKLYINATCSGRCKTVVEKRASIQDKQSSSQSASQPASMELLSKISIIIYVFIFAKLFHCIDVSNETMVEVSNESTNIINTTESNSLNQTTKFDGSIQPHENGDAMQMCNQSFPTPKGTVFDICMC